MSSAPSTELIGSLPPPATRWQSESVAAGYDAERFSSFAGRLFNWRSKRAIRKALGSVPGGPASILDLPCGTGRATAIAREYTARVIGADVSLAMMRQAAARLGTNGPAGFVRCDVARQPFHDGAFDCLTSIRFMMHLDRPARRAALAEMARVAARYVVVEYGRTSTWLRFRRMLRSLVLRTCGRNPSLTRSLPWSEIREDLDAAGLTLVRACPTARGLSESVVLLLSKITAQKEESGKVRR